MSADELQALLETLREPIWPSLALGSLQVVGVIVAAVAACASWRAARASENSTRHQQQASGSDMLLRLWERFDGEGMRAARAQTGRVMIEETENLRPVMRVCAFFELLGFLVKVEGVHERAAWNMFAYDAQHYWAFVGEAVHGLRDRDPDCFTNFEWFVGVCNGMDQRLKGRTEPPTPDDVRSYLEGERLRSENGSTTSGKRNSESGSS